jgi:F-type H+-transporting ATPase subunit gamma
MTQSLRQIKRRIRSVESTAKLTRAMEMISIAKLRSFQNKLAFMKGYFARVDRIWQQYLPKFRPGDHPLLADRPEKKKITLCVVTSDTGLCGSYNADILRLAKSFLQKKQGVALNLVTFGKKGFVYFKREGLAISDAFVESRGHYQQALADQMAQRLIDLFLTGAADEVYAAYTVFENGIRPKAVIEKIINISVSGEKFVRYSVEPDSISFLNDFIPYYLVTKMRYILMNALTAEHSARGMAMGEATDNAKDMLESLTLSRNKIRQANITREIIEVISSSDALRG